MWSDIEYGDGEVCCTARSIDLPTQEKISENKSSFWISGCYLGIGMTVYKGCAEYVEIERLISELSYRKLSNYLSRLVLTGLSPSKLKKAIDSFGAKREHDGKEKALLKVREAIGVFGILKK